MTRTLICAVHSDAPPTMSFRIRGDFVVFVNGHREPRDAEWSVYFDAVEAQAESHPSLRILIVTDGGAPSPTQRRRASELSSRIKLRSAVVTDSLVARTIVTAFSWLKLDIKAFGADQFAAACAYLHASEAEREWAASTAAALKSELGTK